jgi:hypothetical protein
MADQGWISREGVGWEAAVAGVGAPAADDVASDGAAGINVLTHV